MGDLSFAVPEGLDERSLAIYCQEEFPTGTVPEGTV